MANFDEFNDYNNQYEKSLFSNLQFTGTALGCVGYILLISIGITLTAGLLYPFLTYCFVRWCVEKTLYKGKNLRFTGSCGELYVKSIIWSIIGIFTFGIGFLFLTYYYIKWIIENIVVD